jgi:hypothetical protein
MKKVSESANDLPLKKNFSDFSIDFFPRKKSSRESRSVFIKLIEYGFIRSWCFDSVSSFPWRKLA